MFMLVLNFCWILGVESLFLNRNITNRKTIDYV